MCVFFSWEELKASQQDYKEIIKIRGLLIKSHVGNICKSTFEICFTSCYLLPILILKRLKTATCSYK